MARRTGIILSCLLLAVPAATAAKVVAVDVTGVIHPVTVEILTNAMAQAEREKADLLLLRLNTPGGLMDAMRECIEKIVASPVPVVAYVTPSGGRAASAGFFLLQAADVAAMAPGTNTGAASPVLMGQQMDATMRQKVENDAAASLRSLTAKRGRNAALAEKAVLEAKSFTEVEALEQKLIDLIAASEEELWKKLDGREIARFSGARQKLALAEVTVVEYQRNTREKILSAIANPNAALILLALGALGIYIEFNSPGLIAPGVAGAIMVLLGLAALSVFPINWLGAALLILALVLFVLEAKFASGGILGVGGAVAMTLGALLLIDSPIPELRIQFPVALGIAIPFALITIFLLSLVIKARANKVETGAEGLVGKRGEAITPIGARGKVFVQGEYWDARSEQPIAQGARVRVTGVEGLLLTVCPEELSAQPPAATDRVS